MPQFQKLFRDGIAILCHLLVEVYVPDIHQNLPFHMIDMTTITTALTGVGNEKIFDGNDDDTSGILKIDSKY